VLVQRIELACNCIQRRPPGDGELAVHQALGQGGVAQPCKAVVATGEVGGSAALQLAGQPLAAVEPNLDIEGKPGLDAAADETKARVEIVLVQVQALSRLKRKPLWAGSCARWYSKVMQGSSARNMQISPRWSGCSLSSRRAKASLSTFELGT